MPTAENRIARIGIETMPPMKRGASTRLFGSIAIMLHRRELLAGLHQADLGRQRGAGAAGEQQRRDDRPELAHQRQVDDQAERLGGAVGDERVVHLQRQHEADRQARGDDDDQRAGCRSRGSARRRGTKPAQRRRAGAQQVDEEVRVMAQDAQDLERARPSQATRPVMPASDDDAASCGTPKSSASGVAG